MLCDEFSKVFVPGASWLCSADERGVVVDDAARAAWFTIAAAGGARHTTLLPRDTQRRLE